MSSLKVVLICGSGRRDENTDPAGTLPGGGWAETYWADSAAGPAFDEKVKALIRERCTLMSNEAFVSGFRVTDTSNGNRTKAARYLKFGSSALRCDNVEQSLSWVLRATGDPNRRVLTLRGVPDARVAGGTYKKQPDYDAALRSFFRFLLQDPWRFRGKDLSGDSKQIATISAEGLVTLDEDHTFVDKNPVQVLRSIAVGHRLKGISTIVNGAPVGRAIQLRDWPFGASVRGRLRLIKTAKLYPMELSDDEIITPEVRERQTGGPSKRSRGRRSARYA